MGLLQEYNLGLEAVAANWSTYCNFSHRPAETWPVDGVAVLGESIYVDALYYRSLWSLMIDEWYY